MRKPILSLAVVALVVAACGSSASSPGYVPPPDPQHHGSTPEPPPRAASSPYDGVTYEDPGTNPTTDTDEDSVSTFAMDVDTASYTIAQRYVGDGNSPDPASVRVEEWVNAFDQGYRPPTDATFAVHVDGAPAPVVGDADLLLRIGIQARESSERKRPMPRSPSSSTRPGRWAARTDSSSSRIRCASSSWRSGAAISIAVVAFGDDARVVLPPTPATDEETILGAIDDLEPGGSTNLEAGLRLGYALARETLLGEGIDRVILASDGVANVGLTDADDILGQIRRDAQTGIELVSVGVGMGNYNDALLEQLADQGDGFYAYVNDLAEARRLFTEDLTSTLQTVALDAKVQVDFDPEVVATYRLLGYENRAVADEDFRDPTVDAGAIGAGHAVTALYAIDLRDGFSRDDSLGSIRLRWTEPGASRESSLTRDIAAADLAARFRDADPTLRLDAIVAATALAVRDGQAGRGDLRDILEVARQDDGLPASDQADAFIDLLERLTELGR